MRTTDVQIFDRRDLSGVRALLLDADDNLFGSEDPAFVAATRIVNQLMEAIGCEQRFTAEELRRVGTGVSFRSLAADLTAERGRPIDGDELERWVEKEKVEVTRHLGEVLGPDGEVQRVLRRLAERYTLAVVSSSALQRLEVSFRATELDEIVPPEHWVSAEDSLPRPTSKPDPAVYREALARLGIGAEAAIAVEDSPTGVAAAVAAGIPTLGNTVFVPDDERAERVADLRRAGAFAVASSWAGVERQLLG